MKPKTTVKKTDKLLLATVSKKVILDDKAQTQIHIAVYNRNRVVPRIVFFDEARLLSEWCYQNNIKEAINGGFFSRKDKRILGEGWSSGKEKKYTPFSSPWQAYRGTAHICDKGSLTIDTRHNLPAKPDGDLLQAGPMLIKDGINIINDSSDSEGFSSTLHQFDSDITIGRYPRSAIGVNKENIILLTADGRNAENAGLTLSELSDVMLSFGAVDALNLDGGGSATLISSGRLVNNPRSDKDTATCERPIYSAITLASC